MKKIFVDKKTLKSCKIYGMLKAHAKEKHLSFHTPGHKTGPWDITELSYSDNLSCPRGVLADAEKDIASVLGAKASFILTDGSTCGIFSLLKASGAKKIALSKLSHKSVFNACKLLGIQTVFMENSYAEKIPLQPGRVEMSEKLRAADALFLTSPDYYGNVADLAYARKLCDGQNKLLLIDGAHGGHLHFDKALYAGTYADLWVDGVHKSLPALTQGAMVSARTETLADSLREAADFFRTTSPSYPIMASVEYAVKYPENKALQTAVFDFAASRPDRIRLGGDWTKLCAICGDYAFSVQKHFEKRGIYAEFCDGNVVMFYLSPATRLRDFKKLTKELNAVFDFISDMRSPDRDDEKKASVSSFSSKTFASSSLQPAEKTEISLSAACEWIPLEDAAERICARACGLFPPCIPLLFPGDTIRQEQIELLRKAENVFGLSEGKICVFR